MKNEKIKIKSWEKIVSITEQEREGRGRVYKGQSCIFNYNMKYLCGKILTIKYDKFGYGSKVYYLNKQRVNWIIKDWMIDTETKKYLI